MAPTSTRRSVEIQTAGAVAATSAPRAGEIAFLTEALQAEAGAVARLATRVGEQQGEWTAALDLLEACPGHVVVVGMGKSGLVGAKISATFSSLGQPSSVLHPAEAVHGDLGRVRRGDVVLLLSYSGETDEVVNLAAILKADDVPRLGISCSPRTGLARQCTAHLSLGDLTEACPLNLTPSASTTAMLAVGDALALALARRREFKADDFHRHHPGGMLGAGLRTITEALRFKVGENAAVVPDTLTVGEALEQAGDDRRPGAIMLVDTRGTLSGILTDSDVRRLVRRDPHGLVRPVATVMTRHPLHLTVDDLVRDAVRLVRERRLDEIPVLDHDGKPVGLVDVQDLVAMKVVTE
jgi:arabinose-5-phosphate isomerase